MKEQANISECEMLKRVMRSAQDLSNSVDRKRILNSNFKHIGVLL
jgi:hypothetical protein